MKGHRYNLEIHPDDYERLKEIADSKQITIAEILRKFIKLGLYATKLDEHPFSHLYANDKGEIKRIVLFDFLVNLD